MMAAAQASSPGASRTGVIPILMYHSIRSDPDGRMRRLTTTPSDFTEQLSFLAGQGFTSLTVSDLVALRADEGLPVPERPFVITFDDGYADFAVHALPALQEAGFCATLFVTSAFLDGPGRSAPRGRPHPQQRMLRWVDLPVLADAGVEVGAHGTTHIALDRLGPALVTAEVATVKRRLEDCLGSEVSSFAYPFGYSSVLARSAVIRSGYRAACGVRHGLSTWYDDVFELTRIEVSAKTTLRGFSRWVSGGGLRVAPCAPRARTVVWRTIRRLRHPIGGEMLTDGLDLDATRPPSSHGIQC